MAGTEVYGSTGDIRCQVLINSLTRKVGPNTQVTSNATDEDFAETDDGKLNRIHECQSLPRLAEPYASD